ncbi:MAG: hypothetical protein AB7H53_07610 [Hyphomicrobium sp.]
MNASMRVRQRAQSVATAFVCQLLLTTAVQAAPPIRTDTNNRVPACVSPERLMAFLRDRNEELNPRYGEIARWYKYYGEAWNVRWDYAFFQMLLETNYLKYRRGDGRRGDVHERQNNFAGIGATGGGVAGERFADIKTGVHAQIQHLVAYSGEHVQDPVAKRTSENQDDIIAQSRRLRRAVTFGDLARRWAADRAYARSIDIVAKLFNDGYCKGPATADIAPPPAPKPVRRYERHAGLAGPAPDHLGGPEEVLPWASRSVAQETSENTSTADKPRRETRTPPPQTVPAAAIKETPPPPGHNGRPPVRTLWTREDGYDPADSRARATEQARPAGRLENSDDNPQHASAGASEEVQLPHFRIAPTDTPPSHLGGPVDPVIKTASVPARIMPDSDTPSDDARRITTAVRTASLGECRILSASYGGHKTLLVQADASGATQLTALTVLDGFEDTMLESYAKERAPGAKLIGTYASRDDALTKARTICPSG